MSSLAYEGFGQNMLICILCHRWHRRGLENACEIHFCASLAWKRGLVTHVEIYFQSSLVWHVFGPHLFRCISCPRRHLLACAGFGQNMIVSSLSWKGISEHMLRDILCPRWSAMGLVITSCDSFCGLAHMGVALITRVIAGMGGVL